MKDAIAFLPPAADFQPPAILPAFPFQGKSGVRRCFAVGHGNGFSTVTGAGKDDRSAWPATGHSLQLLLTLKPLFKVLDPC